jgi:hypothetical protein
MPTFRRTIVIAAQAAAGLAALFLLLAIPAPEPRVPPAPARGAAFAWDRDAFWRALETRFAEVRAAGCHQANPASARGIADLTRYLAALGRDSLGPDAPVFDSLEAALFSLGPVVAACPARLRQVVALEGRMRGAVKLQSRHWDVSGLAARRRLYRALYGGRGLVEELQLNHPDSVAALYVGPDAPSATPSAVVQGVRIHSGDILVSRGGYPTSALIARGNDYPGNFSHVALVHVDAATGAASTIEAHIERGVVVSSAEQYLADKKLRILVLRLRADLPTISTSPMLPHRAASAMLARARAGHIPYDFAMDYADPSKLFCSEVASAAYHAEGITLWTGLSTISGAGLRRWLAAFGVRHFETQEPSDLEYDPQLAVVAEWRDPAWLLRDHVDNAVTDAMLEGAERGDALRYAWYALPLARVVKGYSWVLERFGKVGPIPEGMSPTAALRNSAYTARHRALAARVRAEAERVAAEKGYFPPYWVLLDLARAAVTRVG